jgi:hypothetical protein
MNNKKTEPDKLSVIIPLLYEEKNIIDILDHMDSDKEKHNIEEIVSGKSFSC